MRATSGGAASSAGSRDVRRGVATWASGEIPQGKAAPPPPPDAFAPGILQRRESARVSASRPVGQGLGLAGRGSGPSRRPYQRGRSLRLDWEMTNLRTVASLRHPGVVAVFGVSEIAGRQVIVEEYLAYGNLSGLLTVTAVPLEFDTVTRMALCIASGCRYLQEQAPPIAAVLHPDRILIDAYFTAKVRVEVKSTRPDRRLHQQRGGGAAGDEVNFWTAPEVFSGESPPTGKSDVFAFGLILFELFTREEVFAEELRAGIRVEQILFAMCEQDLRPQFFVWAVSGPSKRSSRQSGSRKVNLFGLSGNKRVHQGSGGGSATNSPMTSLHEMSGGGGSQLGERKFKRMLSRRGRSYDPNRVEVPRGIRDLAADAWHRNPMRRPTFSEVEDVLQDILKAHHEELLFSNIGDRNILHDVLPAHVVETLKAGRKVLPESFEHVTIFFSCATIVDGAAPLVPRVSCPLVLGSAVSFVCPSSP